MPFWKYYHQPRTVTDAIQASVNAPGSAKLFAGGADLLLDLQQGHHRPVETHVDVTSIPELTTIDLQQRYHNIGAAVPLSPIVSSSLVEEHARVLEEACGLIGCLHLRNITKLGGNTDHALHPENGSFGEMGVGEIPSILTMPEKTNAIHFAVGVRTNRLPVDQEEILKQNDNKYFRNPGRLV